MRVNYLEDYPDFLVFIDSFFITKLVQGFDMDKLYATLTEKIELETVRVWQKVVVKPRPKPTPAPTPTPVKDIFVDETPESREQREKTPFHKQVKV
jgi:hypothetical protein